MAFEGVSGQGQVEDLARFGRGVRYAPQPFQRLALLGFAGGRALAPIVAGIEPHLGRNVQPLTHRVPARVQVDVGRNGSIINSRIEECFTWH